MVAVRRLVGGSLQCDNVEVALAECVPWMERITQDGMGACGNDGTLNYYSRLRDSRQNASGSVKTQRYRVLQYSVAMRDG